jgi:hypothetical protein
VPYIPAALPLPELEPSAVPPEDPEPATPLFDVP